MNLTHEYNEYVVGYVITDNDTLRALNFQLEKIDSNHPSPDWDLYHSCAGDETHNDWRIGELVTAQNYVDSQEDIQEWLREVNKARDEMPKEFLELISGGEVEKNAFNDLVNQTIK